MANQLMRYVIGIGRKLIQIEKSGLDHLFEST